MSRFNERLEHLEAVFQAGRKGRSLALEHLNVLDPETRSRTKCAMLRACRRRLGELHPHLRALGFLRR